MRMERTAAWILTFFLTVLLAVTALGAFAVQAMTSINLHRRVAADSEVVCGQMEVIDQEIDMLSEGYGFSSQRVKETIQQEELAEMNQHAADWWTKTIAGESTDDLPEWKIDGLEEAIADTLQDQEYVEEVTNLIEKKIRAVVMPLRESLLTTGISFLNRRIDLQEALRITARAPVLGLMFCLIIAGLIALLLAKRIRISMKYYGTAAAGAALTVIAAAVLFRILDFHGMIQTASEGLAREYSIMMRSIDIEMCILSAALLAAGFFCLRKASRQWDVIGPDGKRRI